MTWEKACEILGVSAEAPMDEIKRTYRQLMLRLHPDVSGAASYPYTAQEVNRAYGWLKKTAAPEPVRADSGESASLFWDAPVNPHAFREREIYCPAEDGEGEILGHFSLARGKYLWTPEEEFSLFLRSLHQCARQILEEWEAASPLPGRLENRMSLLTELIYLLAQQYVDSTALLEELAREEPPEADGSRLFWVAASLEGPGASGLIPGKALYPAKIRRHRLYVQNRERRELGYLSFPDDRLYYAVIPLLEQRRALVKLVAESAPRRLRLWLKIPREHSAAPENLNLQIGKLREEAYR